MAPEEQAGDSLIAEMMKAQRKRKEKGGAGADSLANLEKSKDRSASQAPAFALPVKLKASRDRGASNVVAPDNRDRNGGGSADANAGVRRSSKTPCISCA